MNINESLKESKSSIVLSTLTNRGIVKEFINNIHSDIICYDCSNHDYDKLYQILISDIRSNENITIFIYNLDLLNYDDTVIYEYHKAKIRCTFIKRLYSRCLSTNIKLVFHAGIDNKILDDITAEKYRTHFMMISYTITSEYLCICKDNSIDIIPRYIKKE